MKGTGFVTESSAFFLYCIPFLIFNTYNLTNMLN